MSIRSCLLRKANFVLVLFFIVPTFSKSTSNEKSAEKWTERVQDETHRAFMSPVYRSKVLWSPLYRFKVIDAEERPQFKEAQDFYALRDECLKNGELFEDPEFEAVDSSLYYNKTNAVDYMGVKWLRPHEISNKPTFIVDGASRTDIKQGEQGDCWFMAVLANAASLNETLFPHIVPVDQGFQDKYCGIFHFRFWQMGHWIDVVIDDRLPTKYGSLMFAKSSQKNEYWSALFEKAYAKLYGSYEALNGGYEYEAMEDLTGGVVVSFNLNQLLPVPDLFRIMEWCLTRHSVITAEIEKKESEEGSIENKGLANNHAYSITNVQLIDVTTPKKTDKVKLVRVRNPWGSREWTGPWRDDAREWDFVSDEDKKKLGLKKANDGEYWMTYKDFISTFDSVSVCLINPNIVPEISQDSRIRWEVSVFKGEWVRGTTAAGCSVDTLHQNPQYQITIEDSNDQLSTVFVGLMQESQRALRNFVKAEEKYIPIGFVIYKSENSSLVSQSLSAEYIHQHKWFETSHMYNKEDQREVTIRLEAPPGIYYIIPCTQHSNVEGEFVLRVVTAKKNHARTF